MAQAFSSGTSRLPGVGGTSGRAPSCETRPWRWRSHASFSTACSRCIRASSCRTFSQEHAHAPHLTRSTRSHRDCDSYGDSGEMRVRLACSGPYIAPAHHMLLRTAGKTESKEMVDEEMCSTSERAAEREAISSRVLMRVSASISFILVCRSSCEGTA